MENVKVEIGSDQTVTIDKMFGPTIFCDIRVTARLKDCKWVFEREFIKQDDDGIWLELHELSFYVVEEGKILVVNAEV